MMLEPIQVPFKQRWRDIRTRFVPVIVFGVVLISVLILWGEKTQQSSFIGKVMADTAHVSSPLTGMVTGFTLQEFDKVEAGDVIAVVMVADSALLAARLNVFKTQINLLRATQDPLSDVQRNLIDRIALQVDVLNERLEFESLNLRRLQLERMNERVQELHRRSLISAQALEDSTLQLELVRTAVAAKERLIRDMEREMERLSTYQDGVTQSSQDPIRAGVAALEAEMEAVYQEFKPIGLKAPITGTVAKVYARNGANLNGGEPLVMLASPTPTHIIGYIRQPVTVRPYVSMEVQLRTRTYPKSMATAIINNVGAQIMVYDVTLQRGSGFIESGIPVRISLDGLGHLNLIPGEIVDILVANP
jgi:multidrug resistance efflux pump